MRRTGTFVLVLALSGCGAAVPAPHGTPTPPTRIQQSATALTCGDGRVHLGGLPTGLTRSGGFNRVKALPKRLKVNGYTWRRGSDVLRVGVVCGVRTAEQFATLVTRSTLSQHAGRPALTWRTRGDLRNYMWLARPGTAVYLAATPALAPQLPNLATTTTIN